MSKFDELLASLTDEDGIPSDFVEGAKIAYDEDIAAIRAEHDSAISTLSSEHESAIAALKDAHGAELQRVKDQAFADLNSGSGGDNFPETYGDETIDEITSFEAFWQEAE